MQQQQQQQQQASSASKDAAPSGSAGAPPALPPDSPVELAKVICPLLTSEDGGVLMTSQSMLYLARDLTGKEVVLKRTMARDKRQLDCAQNEVSLLRKIRHTNIVGFGGVWNKPLDPCGSEINLVIELCPGGNLSELRKRREVAGRSLTEPEIVRIFLQACRGVECLHRFDPPIAHRDVKLENFLLGGEDGKVVKLCDFGSCTTRRLVLRTKEDRARMEEEVLRLTTPSYRAPELVDLFSLKLISEQVDVWALGCTLFALAYGKHAFGEEASNLAIINCKYSFPLEPYYSQEFKLLLYWLLDPDPNLRPRVGDVVDELDSLLGNKIKMNAEKRGSGKGDRSAFKLDAFLKATNPPPVKSVAKKSAPAVNTTTAASTTSRGSSFAPPTSPSSKNPSARASAMQTRRKNNNANNNNPVAQNPPPPPNKKNEKLTSNTNPFDDDFVAEFAAPSQNPTFFSTPGLNSTSIAGFPDLPSSSQTNEAGEFPPSSTSKQSLLGSSSMASVVLPQEQQQDLQHVVSTLVLGEVQQPSHAPIFFSEPPPQYNKNM